MKRQKQIDESKEMIASAFMRLLRENDYDDLTLSEIADHAGVTRMTLYRHFKTKEKIVLYQAQQTLEEQEARVQGKDQPIRELLIQRLELVRNLPQLPILLRSREIEELLDYLRIAAYRSRLEQFVGKRFADDPYFFHFYFGGLNRIVREWLNNECQESSLEIADRITSLTRAFAAAARSSAPDPAGG
ncbi:TetR family transcriptional regulator [Candidatus Bipolaricaulota bacterium]|nr:TetR family transcriptional regulator [Candidatus Bipolaricaulota bacterium]